MKIQGTKQQKMKQNKINEIEMISKVMATVNATEIEGHEGKFVNLASLGNAMKEADINVGKLVPFFQRHKEDFEVAFILVKGLQVAYVRRVTKVTPVKAPRPRPVGKGAADIIKADYIPLEKWAYFSNINEQLQKLANMAQPEVWEYQNGLPKFPKFPILYNYLRYTFCRLQHQKKVVTSVDGNYAAFNTGLADSRFEPIIALFKKNRPDSPSEWILMDFVIEGENLGKLITKEFDKKIEHATYLDKTEELIYDERLGAPVVDREHVLIERMDRLPEAFLQQCAPRKFQIKPLDGMNKNERESYLNELREAVRNDSVAYRNMMYRLDNAIDLAMKRIRWSCSTAVPMFFPKENRMCLLLPLCLVDEYHVDVALVVSRTKTNKYEASTILPLDWAYTDARVVNRPAGDWLNASSIPGSGETLI